MTKKTLKRACQVCKNRKKKCSGGLPCEYCLKICKPHECVYRSRVPRKTVSITENYLQSLKAKIRELENQLGNSSPTPTEFLQDANPLVSNKDEDGVIDGGPYIDESKLSNHTFHYLGDSACRKYLSKIKQSLIKSSKLTDNPHNSDFRTISLDIAPNISLVRSLSADVCPPISEAKKCIATVYKIIGADYLFIEPGYEVDILENLIYCDTVDSTNFMRYSTEMVRFLTYLSLGCLFENSNSDQPRSKFPGLSYFECALKLQGELLKVYDCIANTSLVQSFLYVAYYALSLDKPAFAFIQVGNAIRMMYALGHHKRTTNPDQNRVFWLCFVYDRIVAIRFGYPLTINESDVDIPLFPVPPPERNSPPGSISMSLEKYHFISQVQLARITTDIVRKIYTRNTASFIANCHLVLTQLKNWLDNLPKYLDLNLSNLKMAQSRSTINLHINYNYSIMITTRPVLFYVFNKVLTSGKGLSSLFSVKSHNTIQTLLKASVEAANLQSVILTTLYFEGVMANASFLDCHYIFSATIILIFAAFCQSLPNYTMTFGCDISTLFDRVQTNLDILQRLSQYNIPASNFNRQLTEFIDLISSKGVQTTFQGYFQSDLPERYEDSKPQLDSQAIKNIDLTRVLDDMSNTNFSNDAVFFDNEDFLRYSNSF
ncbi:hypothetical protein HG535_0C06370 [Zygotorulaspora mrakii]|uniref:Zn(2)-C6 fungal-type domain-containing protein n=1 Tax=Zygotorulaspora mrakii TaxID=42260 RepID=A0A7H9B3F1_ZYGMR|nr:uncharacterized protein HG535_0C06370 [Zygotorulaspora mrakii]QLG72282.1 hypothetical protein HG535_0C06370 [Zygotorulaspora mrakii]